MNKKLLSGLAWIVSSRKAFLTYWVTFVGGTMALLMVWQLWDYGSGMFSVFLAIVCLLCVYASGFAMWGLFVNPRMERTKLIKDQAKQTTE